MAREGFVARLLKPCAVAAFLAVVAACGGGGEPARTVTTVSVSSPTSTPKQGDTVQLTAVARDQFGDVVPGTTATWSSSAPSVATVSATGLLQALAGGSVTVTARISNVPGTLTLTVTPRTVTTVTVTSPALTPQVGSTVQLAAEARDQFGEVVTGRTATWTTSAPGVAAVSATGLLQALAPGAVTATATIDGVPGSLLLTVTAAPRVTTTVTVSGPTATPTAGETVQLTVVARDQFGDVIAGKSATWSTSDAAIAAVSATGLVQALAPGTVSVTATVDGVAGSVLLTVAAAPTWASVTGGKRLDYELDATRRIKSYELRIEASGRVTQWCTGDLHASWQCRYEENAPYRSSSATVDAQGRFRAYEYRSEMPSGENASYTYDERGRLVAVDSSEYTYYGNIITSAIKLEYDGLGRLAVIRHDRRSAKGASFESWNRLYTITPTNDVPASVLMTGEDPWSGTALPSYSIRLTHDGSGRFTGKDVYEILATGESLSRTVRYGIDAYGYLTGVEWCLVWSVSAQPLLVSESRCPASPPTSSIVYPSARMPSAPLRVFPAYTASSGFDLLCVIADECLDPARRYLLPF